SGTVHFEAASAELFPGNGSGFHATGISGDFTFTADTANGIPAGGLGLNIANITIQVGSDAQPLVQVSASNLSLRFSTAGAIPPDIEFASAETTTVILPQLKLPANDLPLGITVNDLRLFSNGFSVGSVTNTSAVNVRLGNLVEIGGTTSEDGIRVTATDLKYTFANGDFSTGSFSAGSLVVQANVATFLPDDQGGGLFTARRLDDQGIPVGADEGSAACDSAGERIPGMRVTLSGSSLQWEACVLEAKFEDLLEVRLVHPQLFLSPDDIGPIL